MGNYEFDLDLPEGEFAEELVKSILCEKGRSTIEVKRDFYVSDSGNVAIEYRARGNKSGIAVTKAEWWAFVLDGDKYNHEIIIFIKTERLREIARAFYQKGSHTKGGDDLSSEMVLIPVLELLK